MGFGIVQKRWPVKPPLGARLDTSHPLAHRAVGIWPMAEGGGSILQDAMGRLPMPITGADWSRGTHGAALHTGTGKYAERTRLQNFTDFTIAALVKPASAGGLDTVISQENGADHAAFFLRASDQSGFFGDGDYRVVSPPLPSVGIWSLIAMTYDRNTLATSVNGKIIATAAITATPATDSDQVFSIGRLGTFNQSFDGLIAGVWVYSRCLSTNELKWLASDPWSMFRRSAFRIIRRSSVVSGARFGPIAGCGASLVGRGLLVRT